MLCTTSRCPVARALGDDADVEEAVRQAPRHDVAGLVVRAGAETLAAAREERHQVRHAAMVDVAVGPRRPQSCGYAAKCRRMSSCTATWRSTPIVRKARTTTSVQTPRSTRHVAAGIVEPPIGRVVDEGDADLGSRGAGNGGAAGRRLLRDERRRDESGGCACDCDRDEERAFRRAAHDETSIASHMQMTAMPMIAARPIATNGASWRSRSGTASRR